MKKIFIITGILLFCCNCWAISIGSRPAIESIQAGSFTVASGSASSTTTISAVDTSRSVLVLNGIDIALSDYTGAWPYIELTNSTTITGYHQSGTTGVGVQYMVIEFAKGTVKNKYEGTINIAAGNNTNDDTISPAVKIANCIIFYDGVNCTINQQEDNVLSEVFILDANTVRASRNQTAGSINVHYSMVEFYDWVVP